MERTKNYKSTLPAVRIAPTAYALAILLIPFVCGGATCARRKAIPDFAPPVVFKEAPSLEQLTSQINRSLAITSIASNNLTLSSPDISAKLDGTLKWERPHNFALEAYPTSRAFGIVMAAGSNSEMFWLKTQRPSPPTVYFAKHDQFEQQQGPRNILPVSPLWLREAFGVVEIDPNGRHEGPRIRPDGKMELTTYSPSPRGDYRRVLVLSSSTAAIEQTVLYNQDGKLVAVAQQSEQEYYSKIDWSLPKKVQIQLIPDSGPPMNFTIEVGFYLINEGPWDSKAFEPPDPTGISTVNLINVNSGTQSESSTPPIYTTTEPTQRESRLINFRTVR